MVLVKARAPVTSIDDAMETYLRQFSPVTDHLDSFDYFVSGMIQHVNSIALATDAHRVEFSNAQMTTPVLEEHGKKKRAYPDECRVRKLNYNGNLVCDVTIDGTRHNRVMLGKIPVMVGSRYCSTVTHPRHALDREVEAELGGYFIVNGSEKSIIAQERLGSNFMLAETDKMAPRVVEFRAQRAGELKVHTLAVYAKQGVYYGETKVYKPFPLIAFATQALGVDETVAHREIGGDVPPAWELCFNPDHILPNLNANETFTTIVSMVRYLESFEAGRVSETDRDHYAYKRVDWSGDLLLGLFKQILSRFTRDITTTLQRPDLNRITPASLLRPTTITNGLKFSISTGNWGISSAFRTGVSQVLHRLNKPGCLAQLRRINSPVRKESIVIAPRMLHGSAYGRICPSETPEGANTGLHKSLAVGARVSSSSSGEAIELIALSHPGSERVGMIELQAPADTRTILFINGAPKVRVSDPKGVVALVRRMRRRGDLALDASIRFEPRGRAIWAWTDRGRYVRPLFIGTNPPTTGEWVDWLVTERVEYLDAWEEMDAVVYTGQGTIPDGATHREIDPTFLFGVGVSEIPFANFNQAPRNVYQTSQRKQALSVPTWDYHRRLDTTNHLLWYPQKPLSQTRYQKLVCDDLSNVGQNVVLAFACFTGYNQEDSILVNRASIDRGLFRATTFKTHMEELHGDQIFARPQGGTERLFSRYDRLEHDGFPAVGGEVSQADVVVGRVHKSSGKDASVESKIESGRVNKVCLATPETGKPFVQVQTRQVRVPEIGDKFCSRAGQKGTIGCIVEPEDMPFGETPVDVIINPHALPSRMTIAQVMEMLTGKAAALSGDDEVADATSFRRKGADIVEEAAKILRSHGFSSDGTEWMINGKTGIPFEARIFSAPCYYLRLHHLSSDKVTARARGPIQGVTRQPTDNATRGSQGQRVGDMECSSFVGHGASSLVSERMLKGSDLFQVKICRVCGSFAAGQTCTKCGEKGDVSEIETPYSFKLLAQELFALGVDVSMH